MNIDSFTVLVFLAICEHKSAKMLSIGALIVCDTQDMLLKVQCAESKLKSAPAVLLGFKGNRKIVKNPVLIPRGDCAFLLQL